MEVSKYVQIAFVVVCVVTIFLFGQNYRHTEDIQENSNNQEKHTQLVTTPRDSFDRPVVVTDMFELPIKDIVPNEQLRHSIQLDEIRQGCSKQDCILSVDSPKFISIEEASKILTLDQIGIALSYKGEHRFYPFSMLVTREIVNDVVAGDALLVTYCPLCGTGIVFDRTIAGSVYEFGVSGMLWQSNLLMYNRSIDDTDRSLWSQILGEAVVGGETGTSLAVIPSDIMQFDDWLHLYPSGLVLQTDSQYDPYSGEYYNIAKRFAPNFNAQTSPFAPDTYVYGIEVGGRFKAYPRDLLPEGEIRDMINGEEITIINNDGKVTFQSSGKVLVDIEGFWFSWVAAHPETAHWSKN